MRILAFLLPTLLAGAGAVRGLDLAPRSSWATRMGWSYILGMAIVGTVGALGSLFAGLPLGLPVLGLSILLTAPGFLRGRRAVSGSARRMPLWAAIPLFLCSAVLVAEALAFPVRDFDGRMTWIPAAQYMRAERSVLATPIVTSELWVSHPQYPPLLPGLRATALLVAGTDDERVSRPLDSLFLPAALLVLFGALRGFAGQNGAGTAVVLALLTPALSTESHGGAAGTYADIPMGIFVFGGLLLLLRARSIPVGVAAALLLLAGVLSKNEALPIVVGGLAIVAVSGVARRRKRLRVLVPAAALLIVGALALARWHHEVPNRYDEDYGAALRSTTATKILGNLQIALPAIVRSSGDPRGWGIALGVLAALLLFERRKVRKVVAPVLLAALPPAVGLVAFAVTPWEIEALVSVTWPRFLVQAFAPLFVVTAFMAGSFLRASRRTGARERESGRHSSGTAP